MSAGKMWTTVQSEVNRADSAMSDAANALQRARQLEAQATAALADAYNMTAEAIAQMQRAQQLLKEHGPDHEIPYDGAL